MYNFNNSKKVFLRKKDKSNKRSLDDRITGLCRNINNSDNYFTTSSCSGRIVLLKDENKKRNGLFLFRTHDLINFNEFKDKLNTASNNYKEGIILFKQEPCFIIISCKDNKSQWELFNHARNNGWKKSGILSLDKKFLVEVMSTENISFPVVKDSKVIVNDEFLKIVLEKANNNLIKGWLKINNLKKWFDR